MLSQLLVKSDDPLVLSLLLGGVFCMLVWEDPQKLMLFIKHFSLRIHQFVCGITWLQRLFFKLLNDRLGFSPEVWVEEVLVESAELFRPHFEPPVNFGQLHFDLDPVG